MILFVAFVKLLNHWINNALYSVSLIGRGLARNLLRGVGWRGAKEGICGTVPQRGPGAEPWWGLGQIPQKLETHAEYSTEQSYRSSQTAHCSESDYTLNKF